MATRRKAQERTSFTSILQADVPHGRSGKHNLIVSRILSDLDRLAPGQALKIPLAELPDTKENVRSALNRASRERGMNVATSSDAACLYVWNVSDTAENKTR